MALQLSILYCFVLAFVLLVAKFSKSKYLETISQQINFMVLFHALLVPISAVVYYVQFDLKSLYENPFDSIMHSFLGMTISYSLVSTFCYIVFLRRKDNHIIFHHISTTFTFLYLIFVFKELPGYWGMIVITQINPFFYHSYLILKETEDVQEDQLYYWYNLNYYMWIIVRIILLGLWITIGVYSEMTIGTLDLKARLIALGFIGLSVYFSINWLFIMIRNRKKMVLAQSGGIK